MFSYERDINMTILVNINNAECSIVHISECYRENNKILFENSGSYYIYDPSFGGWPQYYVFELGFSLDISFSYGSGYMRFNGSTWVYAAAFKSLTRKFVKIDGVEYQKGHYLYDYTSKQFIAQIEAHSDPVDPYSFEIEKNTRSLYKSANLLGVYEWQGYGTQTDITVGWKKYKHKATDSEGNQTSDDVFVTETIGLNEYSSNVWKYKYKGDEYTYSGELSLDDFEMVCNEKTINMLYVELTSLKKDICKFDGGAQNVD